MVLRNVRDSRFRREPYRKRKRASTYISPIHAERPTNDAARARVREADVEGEDDGCGGERCGRQKKKGGKK